ADETESLARVQRLHRERQPILDKQILETILSEQQRNDFQRLKGTPPAFSVTVYKPQSDLRYFQQRISSAEKAKLFLETPYSLAELVQTAEVLEEVQTTPDEAVQLLQEASEWRKSRAAFYQKLRGLEEPELGRKVAEVKPRLNALRSTTEARIKSILG